MKWIISSVVAAVVASGSALAADLPSKAAPAPVPYTTTYNWTGFYVGGFAGYLTGFTSNNTNGVLPNAGASGWLLGLTGAYRYQLPNNVVLGVSVDAPVWGSNQSATVAGVNTEQVHFKGSVVGQGSIGYAIGPFLPMVSAGIGEGWVSAQEIAPPLVSPWVNVTHTVYTVGFGMLYGINEHWSAGLVYNHTWTSQEPYNCGPAVCGIVGSFSLKADTGTGVIEYKF